MHLHKFLRYSDWISFIFLFVELWFHKLCYCPYFIDMFVFLIWRLFPCLISWNIHIIIPFLFSFCYFIPLWLDIITIRFVIFGGVVLIFFHVSYVTVSELMHMLFLCLVYFLSAMFFQYAIIFLWSLDVINWNM